MFVGLSKPYCPSLLPYSLVLAHKISLHILQDFQHIKCSYNLQQIKYILQDFQHIKCSYDLQQIKYILQDFQHIKYSYDLQQIKYFL
jgi:hypothetical protein